MAVSFARFTARNERGWLGRTLLLPQFGSRYWRSDLEQRELGFGGGPRVAALYDEAGCGARGERHPLRERAQASSRRLVGTAWRASRACALGEPSSEDRFLSLLECSPDGVRPPEFLLHDQLTGHGRKGVTFLMAGWQPFRRRFFSAQFAAIVTNETLLRVAEYIRTIDRIQAK